MSEKVMLSLAAYKGFEVDGKSKADLNDMIRGIITEACGGEWNRNSFMANKYVVHAVLEELMPAGMREALAGAFDRFADFADTAMGDKNSFTIPDNKLFNVYTVARGMGAERQRLDNSSISVATDMKMITVYTELDEFMAGKIDWTAMNNRVMMSFANYTSNLIYDAISNSYSSLVAGVKTTGAFDADTLLANIEQVQAYSGSSEVAIFGTKRSLRQVADIAGYSDGEKERFNNFGYYGTFSGIDLLEIPQGFEAGSSTLMLSNNQLLLIPTGGEKIVKVVYEGSPLVNITDGMNRNDMQPEITYGRRIGVATLTAPEGTYGIYNITA